MTQELFDQVITELFQKIQAEGSEPSSSDSLCEIFHNSPQLEIYMERMEILLTAIGPRLISSSLHSTFLTGFQAGQLYQKQESEIDQLEKILLYPWEVRRVSK